MMSNGCCSVGNKKRMVLACSGASNLGQISNSMAVRLQHTGMAIMSCMSAIAADLPSFIADARKVDELLVLDGCSIACAKKIMDAKGIGPYRYFDIGEMLPDLQKEKRYDQIEENVDALWDSFCDAL